MQTPSHSPRSGSATDDGKGLAPSPVKEQGALVTAPDRTNVSENCELRPTPVRQRERYRALFSPLFRLSILIQSPIKTRQELRSGYWLAKMQNTYNQSTASQSDWTEFNECLDMLEYLFKKAPNPGSVTSRHYISATILVSKLALLSGDLNKAFESLQKLTVEVNGADQFSREDRAFAIDVGRLYIGSLKSRTLDDNPEYAEKARENIMDAEVWGLSNFSDDFSGNLRGH